MFASGWFPRRNGTEKMLCESVKQKITEFVFIRKQKKILNHNYRVGDGKKETIRSKDWWEWMIHMGWQTFSETCLNPNLKKPVRWGWVSNRNWPIWVKTDKRYYVI